jgi:phospholipase/carboxylesterase
VAQESLGARAEALGDTPVFWGHGTQDPAVPFSLAIIGRERILRSGVRVQAHDYPMGHWVSEEEMEDLRSWLGEVLPKATPLPAPGGSPPLP